jgi:hypothetical protein
MPVVYDERHRRLCQPFGFLLREDAGRKQVLEHHGIPRGNPVEKSIDFSVERFAAFPLDDAIFTLT